MKKLICIIAFAFIACGGEGSKSHITNEAEAAERVIVKHFNPNQETITGLNHTIYGIYDSGNHGERIDKLPMDKKWRVLYSVRTENLQVGDYIFATFHAQASSEFEKGGMWTSQIILAHNPEDIAIRGRDEVTESGGYNCRKILTHHCSTSKSGGLYITEEIYNSGKEHINVIARSGWSSGDGSQWLDINGDYGRLHVVHYK